MLIRNARPSDAAFLAKVVYSALGLADFDDEISPEMSERMRRHTRLCQREDTLYSYRNARVAESDGRPVGALIAYDGAEYLRLRRSTFTLIKKWSGTDLTNFAAETCEGEYYFDSLAVVPSFRKRKLGLKLLLDRVSIASAKGYDCFTLLVDSAHPRVEAYYASIGFEAVGRLSVFNVNFVKMRLKIN